MVDFNKGFAVWAREICNNAEKLVFLFYIVIGPPNKFIIAAPAVHI
tara:strand:- start:1388 stop:1525 length:138 start_codon:yes stop_codon:yes gene_type:complete